MKQSYLSSDGAWRNLYPCPECHEMTLISITIKHPIGNEYYEKCVNCSYQDGDVDF